MADIEIENVTTGIVDGDGVFDKLMTAVEAQLHHQYTNNRITGSDYATVYLGAMQAAMGQAITFVLGEQQADKQAELTAAQTLEVLAGTIRNDDIAEQEILLKAQQILQSVAQTSLIEEQEQSENKQNEPDGMIDKQILDLISQTETRDNESIEKVNVLQEQVLKSEAEKNLINQKTLTEEAQIKDIVDGNPVFTPKTLDGAGFEDTPASGEGMVGKQQVLLAKQTDGFDRDAEQKASKILMDSYTIRRSTDSAAPPPSKAEDPDINKFLEQLALGTQVALTDTSYNVGGVVSGLTGTGMVLQTRINGGAWVGNLLIETNGSFVFTIPFADGDAYDVRVQVQPNAAPSETAVAYQDSGFISASVGNVDNVLIQVTPDA